MDQSLLSMVSDLGGTLGSLIACFWFIKYQADMHADRERIWLDKDSESDKALRDLMATSNAQLLQVMQQTNQIMQEMTIAITRLEETLKRNDGKQ